MIRLRSSTSKIKCRSVFVSPISTLLKRIRHSGRNRKKSCQNWSFKRKRSSGSIRSTSTDGSSANSSSTDRTPVCSCSKPVSPSISKNILTTRITPRPKFKPEKLALASGKIKSRFRPGNSASGSDSSLKSANNFDHKRTPVPLV